jgi:hypothetical protein
MLFCEEAREIVGLCPEGTKWILLNLVEIEVYSLVGLVVELVPKLELFSHQKRRKQVKLCRLRKKQKLVEPNVVQSLIPMESLLKREFPKKLVGWPIQERWLKNEAWNY